MINRPVLFTEFFVNEVRLLNPSTKSAIHLAAQHCVESRTSISGPASVHDRILSQFPKILLSTLLLASFCQPRARASVTK